MKAMKGLSVNKVFGGIRRRPTSVLGSTTSSNSQFAGPLDDSPEGVAARNVRSFCESGGQDNSGDEVTFLPAIVDAAESSPQAAAECARLIRKYLNKDYSSKPSFQYNAIMLMRILADNPGMTFTRNVDKKFVETAKELLRYGRDASVRQILMETLDSFEANKPYDESLGPVIEMWKKEKEKAYKAYGIPMQGQQPGVPPPGAPRTLNAPPFNPHSQNYYSRSHGSRRLPEPVELANRLEEARTSAKLLQQVVGCTPPAEVLNNDLIKEFADRCQSASRSIQGYMTAENPGPDNDTMESLIDTNEQLQTALSQHQRAVLNARKHLGLGDPHAAPSSTASTSPPPQAQSQSYAPGGTVNNDTTLVSPIDNNSQSGYGSFVNGSVSSDQAFSANRPAMPPPVPSRKAIGKQADLSAASAAGPSRSATTTPRPAEDPFRDPVEDGGSSSNGKAAVRPVAGASSSAAAAAATDESPRLAFEPFSPGFTSATDSNGGGAGGASSRTDGAAGRGGANATTRDDASDLYSNSDDEQRYKPFRPDADATKGSTQPDPVYRY